MERKITFNKSAIFVLAITLTFLSVGAAIADGAIGWAALKSSGHVALLRHAIAPGTGDPEEFDVKDCATQRNLSAEGRLQAKRIGDRLRANGIDRPAVFSSQWCRCLETARLLSLGPVTELTALNSFFRDFEQRESRTVALTTWIKERDLRYPVILVTHQVNITALTGVYPSSGELIIVRRSENGKLKVFDTIETRIETN